MRSYLEADLKFNRIVRGLHSLPFLLSAIGILVLPITYVHGKTTDYSLGPKAYALYGSIVIYLIFILYYCLRYWKLLDEDKRTAIILAVPIYVVISSIQMLMPEVLLEVVGSSLIMLGLILAVKIWRSMWTIKRHYSTNILWNWSWRNMILKSRK